MNKQINAKQEGASLLILAQKKCLERSKYRYKRQVKRKEYEKDFINSNVEGKPTKTPNDEKDEATLA